MKRGADIMNLSAVIEMQRRALQEMKDNSYPLDDDVTVKRTSLSLPLWKCSMRCAQSNVWITLTR